MVRQLSSQFLSTWPRSVMALAVLLAILGMLMAPGGLARADEFASLDPSARLPDGKDPWERWDLVAKFDSGHLVFGQVWITSIGPGKRNAMAGGYVILPDGQTRDWGNLELGEDNWRLSEDRREIFIDGTLLQMDEGRFRLNVEKPYLKLDLTFAPTGAMVPPSGAMPEGYNLETLALSAPVEAKIWVQEKSEIDDIQSGRVAFNHSWGSDDEAALVPRIIQMLSLNEEKSFQVLDFASSNGERHQWLGLVNDQNILHSASDFELELEGRAENMDGFNTKRYWIPGEIKIQGDTVNGQTALADPIASDELLKHLPRPIRFIVSMLMRPSRAWFYAPVELSIEPEEGTPPVEFNGEELVIFTFMDAVKKPD